MAPPSPTRATAASPYTHRGRGSTAIRRLWKMRRADATRRGAGSVKGRDDEAFDDERTDGRAKGRAGGGWADGSKAHYAFTK